MFNRLTANTLVKSVVATLAAAVILMLVGNAWSSWQRLAAAGRISAAAEASASLFTALDNLRFDRSFTFRGLAGADRFAGPNRTDLEKFRANDIPAMTSAAALLTKIDFADKASLLSTFNQSIQTLTALHQETWSALDKAKAERPAGLTERFMSETQNLLDQLDTLSSRASGAVKRQDAYVDQLFELRQLGSNVRTAAGDSSVVISNVLAGAPVTADTYPQYMFNLGRLKSSLQALDDQAVGAALPPKFLAALAHAKSEYFGPDYSQKRDAMIKALVNH